MGGDVFAAADTFGAGLLPLVSAAGVVDRAGTDCGAAPGRGLMMSVVLGPALVSSGGGRRSQTSCWTASCCFFQRREPALFENNARASFLTSTAHPAA